MDIEKQHMAFFEKYSEGISVNPIVLYLAMTSLILQLKPRDKLGRYVMHMYVLKMMTEESVQDIIDAFAELKEANLIDGTSEINQIGAIVSFPKLYE